MERIIPFSPPDIGQAEIDEVVDTLKSGWITTGPKTKQFEKDIASYCDTEKAVCLNSATAGLELILRLMDIGPGDEVITTPYTFCASANIILHVGAKPVFADVKKGEFNIDPQAIEKAITPRTKAIIPVDIAGWPCDYTEIEAALESKKSMYRPTSGTMQTKTDRPIILADAAHSFGSSYKNKKVGNLADFTVFSFHAVKNLTTAEGGAISFNAFKTIPAEEIYKKLMLLSLHGQSKDALAKMKAGSWQYQIEIPGYKCNMTDIQAALGLAQLRRFDTEMIPQRKKICDIYNNVFKNDGRFILPPFESAIKQGNYHLYPIRLNGADESKRNSVIEEMAKKKIAVNVHFIPVVMHPAYTGLGYSIDSYPNTFDMYRNEITLPVYSKLSLDDAQYLANEFKSLVGG